MRVVDNLQISKVKRSQPLEQNFKTHLNKRLDLAPVCQLFLTHTPRYFPGVPLDASDNSMRVWSLLGALIQLFDNDDLLAGLTALEHDCNLSLHVNPVWASDNFRIYLAGLVYCAQVSD